MEIAVTNSPSIQSTILNLERTRESLNAQRAALKSKFALNVAPIDYSNSRKFDSRTSQWFTNEIINSSGTFRVDQPFLPTDGKISLINTFGWQSNTSDALGTSNTNEAFTTTFIWPSRSLCLPTTEPNGPLKRSSWTMKMPCWAMQSKGWHRKKRYPSTSTMSTKHR